MGSCSLVGRDLVCGRRGGGSSHSSRWPVSPCWSVPCGTWSTWESMRWSWWWGIGPRRSSGFALGCRCGSVSRCDACNARFDEGNGLSVLAAEEALGGAPFLLVMADHVLDRSILWSLVGSEMPSDGAVLAVDLGWRAGGVDLDDVTRVRTEGRLVRDIGKGISSFDAFDTGAFLCTGGVFDALRDAVAAGETSLSAGMHRLADQGRLERCDVTGARWVDVDTRGICEWRRGGCSQVAARSVTGQWPRSTGSCRAG